MVREIRFLIVGLFVFVPVFLRANDYIFEPVTSNTGITFNAISTIIEDKYGFIWFGCNSGLYHYNSSEIEKINFDKTKPDAPRSNIIRSLYRDQSQKLWICTDDGISYFNENSNTFAELPLTNPKGINKLNTTLIHQVNKELFLAIINNRLYSFNLNVLILNRIEIGNQNTSISFFTDINSVKLYI